jgi:hypothetical protein
MLLINKRLSISYFRLGLLLRNIQIMNKITFPSSSSSAAKEERSLSELDNFCLEKSHFYRHHYYLYFQNTPVSSLDLEDINSSDDNGIDDLREKNNQQKRKVTVGGNTSAGNFFFS